jgi:uncharacterized OsmC-like protein
MATHDRWGFTAAQAELVRASLNRRTATTDREGLRGIDRVEIEVIEGLDYRAANPHEAGQMRIGEPVERGGAGEGNSPLSHVLAGAASCLLNQFIRACVVEGPPVRFAGASTKGEFSRAVGGGFERITTEIRAEGELTDGQARALLERAEELCYIHVTLRKAVQMTTVLVVDGIERARSVTGPEA